jgi:chromosome partitioning protein
VLYIHTDRMIDAAKVVENLSVHYSEQLPATESQARPLAQLEPALQQAAWHNSLAMIANNATIVTMKTIAVGNLKGGTGKSATVHNLGAALANAGMRVLLVDCDAQASLTQSCGVRSAAGHSLAEVLSGQLAMSKAICNIGPDLDLVPGDKALANYELALVTTAGRESVIKKALLPIGSNYDVVLLDTHPGLQLLTVAALAASDAVLIPTQPQVVDLRSVRLFLDSIEKIKSNLNPALETLGILVTFYDNRYTHHRQALEAMRGAGLPVLPVMIGRSVRVAEAAGLGQSLLDYDSHNPQAENYQQLGKVILEWQRSKP